MNTMNDNKNNLRMILAVQRARRLTLNPPVLKRNKGMSWKTFFALLGVFVFGVVVLVAMMILARQPVLSDKHLHLTQVQVSSIVTIPVTATHPNATFGSGKVCTNVPAGHLYVRLSPGEGSQSLGYLNEGEPVQISIIDSKLESKTASDNGVWLHLLSPLSGWVNASYICEVPK